MNAIDDTHPSTAPQGLCDRLAASLAEAREVVQDHPVAITLAVLAGTVLAQALTKRQPPPWPMPPGPWRY